MSDTEQNGATEPETPSGGESTAPNEEKPVRPVRMKWGRVIEETPAEEPPVPPPKEEPPKAPRSEPPKPDPRLEALRARLEREAQREAEARKHANAEEAGTDGIKDPVPKPEPRRPSPAEIRAREEREKRAREAEARRLAEENARIREELQREELRRALKRRRRRENILGFFGACVGGIIAAFRRFRISKKQVAAILVTALLAVIAAVILGNLLKDRVGAGSGTEESSGPPETRAETVPPARGLLIPSVNAGVVSLEGATARTLSSEARRFAESGVSEVSLILRDGEGNLLFSSKTDSALGIEGENGELLGIDEILEPFLSRELYVSCILPIRYFVDGDEYSRAVLYAHETALLCEIAEAGADEVLLSDCVGLFDTENGTGSEDTPMLSAADAVKELSGIAREVNLRSPETAVGLALPPEFLSSVESDRYLSSIAEVFDLLLLDLCALAEADDLYAEVSGGVSEHLYFILRYSMRVLIPAGSAEAVTKESVENWQEGTLPILLPSETE